MSITILVNRDTVDYFTEQLNTTIHSITPFDWTKETPNFKGENNDVLVTFAKGKVVSLREANGYHDSDFYATFLNDNGEFVDYCYASTRGWTYANGATIDATPETMEAYAAHITAQNESARRAREEYKNLEAEKCSITREKYDRICSIYINNPSLNRIIKLLQSKLRSPFRIKLANQVREWLNNPSPQYREPLSPKQLQYV